MEQDRRTVNRLPVPRVLVKISTAERMRVAYLKDLSEGGVFIRTEKPLALERVVDVDLIAPGRVEPIRLRGKITRVACDEAARAQNALGMAVKFIELTAQVDAQLKALVQEYTQARPAAPAPSAVPGDDTLALKQALEATEVLRSTLAQREAELKGEHDRRQELSVRVLQLTQELDAVKAGRADGGSVALDALKVELQASRAEATELKSRLQQAATDAEAYRQEIAALEQADTQTRRLAESLAQAKQKLELDLKKARDEVTQQARSVEHERSAGVARSTEANRVLEGERARRAEADGKLEQQAAQSASLQTRVRELEANLGEARKQIAGLGLSVGELAAARTRIDSLEKGLADERAKTARLSNRERELRQLVAAISARGEDVVMMDEAPAPEPALIATTSPSIDITVAIGDALADAPPGKTQLMARLPPLSEQPPPVPDELPPPLEGLGPDDEPTVPQFSAAAAAAAADAAAAAADAAAARPPSLPAPGRPSPLPPQVETLDVDVDMADAIEVGADDWGSLAIGATPGAAQDEFLSRLRSNARLVRRASFFDYSAADKDEEHVIGNLMGGDRYDDLKILARGRCTPEQLESHLLKFHQLGLIGFDA